jgi:hypothetical protein
MLMPTQEQLRQLMTEIGDLLDLPQVAEDQTRAQWALSTESNEILVESFENGSRLMLSGSVGAAPEQRRLAVYEVLLCFNIAWRETGRMRFALDAPGGEAILCLDIAAESNAHALAAIVAEFDARLTMWTTYLAAAEAEAAPQVPQNDEMLIRA